jgi:hypothetical protein
MTSLQRRSLSRRPNPKWRRSVAARWVDFHSAVRSRTDRFLTSLSLPDPTLLAPTCR